MSALFHESAQPPSLTPSTNCASHGRAPPWGGIPIRCISQGAGSCQFISPWILLIPSISPSPQQQQEFNLPIDILWAIFLIVFNKTRKQGSHLKRPSLRIKVNEQKAPVECEEFSIRMELNSKVSVNWLAKRRRSLDESSTAVPGGKGWMALAQRECSLLS